MWKLVVLISGAILISGCGGAEEGKQNKAVKAPELELSVSSYQVGYFPNAFVGVLKVTSLSDEVTITGLEVNRGNCEVSSQPLYEQKRAPNFPRTLGYSKSTSVYALCNPERIREATVITPAGAYSYGF